MAKNLFKIAKSKKIKVTNYRGINSDISKLKLRGCFQVEPSYFDPFKTSNNGDKLAMDSNVANVIDATAGKVKSKNATGAGSSKGMGIDNTPNIESSNPNDSSSIVAEATFNIS